MKRYINRTPEHKTAIHANIFCLIVSLIIAFDLYLLATQPNLFWAFAASFLLSLNSYNWHNALADLSKARAHDHYLVRKAQRERRKKMNEKLEAEGLTDEEAKELARLSSYLKENPSPYDSILDIEEEFGGRLKYGLH